MKVMVLNRIFDLDHENDPLQSADIPQPVPGNHEILIRVTACGVCHTELDEIEGRTPPPHFPVIPGHQVVGIVEAKGPGVTRFEIGNRVGVGWIYSACGECEHCRGGDTNLCEQFKATGRDADGGYAEYMKIHQDFASSIPAVFSDIEAAPLLCAGAIGYRSLRLTGLKDGQNIGLTGFGASAHLVLKMVNARFPHAKTYVFARNENERAFALELGAVWAGDTEDSTPEKLHCIIDTTPAWKPVVEALKNLVPGGRLVINAIRKEEKDKENLLTLDYANHLWMEHEIKSVANVALKDISEFLELAAKIPIKPETQEYKLEEANRALMELKNRQIRGGKVLKIGN